jgi:hypothetical protein
MDCEEVFLQTGRVVACKKKKEEWEFTHIVKCYMEWLSAKNHMKN